jgi:hypothetical protein
MHPITTAEKHPADSISSKRGLLTALLLLLTTTAWAQLSGTYTVGYELGTENYPSLTAAVAALNTQGVVAGQSVTFQLTNPGATKPYDAAAATPVANRETFPITIAAPALSAGQSIRIVAAAGISPLISGSNATAILIADGTDYLTISGYDGSSSARSITIRNTAAGPAVLLRNDATNNALRYLSLESACTGSSGTVHFGTTTGTTGNDSNTIASCDVRDLSVAPNTVPANAIYSLGTAGKTNSDNIIQSCNVYNFQAGGIFLNDTGNGGGWTLDGNNIYQTASRAAALRFIRLTGGDGQTVSNNHIYQQTGTLGSTVYGVAVVSGSGHTITNNYVGGSAASAAGSPMAVSGAGATFYGFYLSLASTTATSIQGNVIRNIASTVSGITYGMQLVAGAANVGTTAGNTIGNASPAAPAVGLTATNTLYGIAIDGGSPTATVSNNTLGGLSNAAVALAGIYFSGSGTSSASGNTISSLSNSAGSLAGVALTGSGAVTVSGNTIADLSNNLTGAGAALAGISSTGTGVVAISNNILSNLRQSGLTSNLYGIQSNSVTGSAVSGNTISSITYSGTSAGQTVYGIFAGGTNSITSNTITNIQATATGNTNLRGIYVGGAGAAATVTGNVVSTILNGTTGTTSTAGIFVGPTTGVMGVVTVRNNRISNVGTTNTASSTSTHTITGLLLGASAAGSVIERNRVWNVYGSSAGTGANADQVRGLAVQGAYSGTFANNQVSLAAGTTTQLSYGIQDLSSGGSTNFYYNSVYLAPAASSAASSYGFWRSAAATPPTVELRNNIFYNERTAAAGATAYAIGTATTTGWSAASSNYNLFVTPDASVMGNWGGTELSFAGWQAAQPAGSGGDATSFYRLNTALPAAAIFTDLTTGNLNINPAYYVTPSIIESGGVAIAGINTDYDGSDIRQGSPGYSSSGTAPDLGADEYNATPPANMAYDPVTGTAVTQITAPVVAGSTNQAVVRVALTTTGSASPLTLTQLDFSADGTTASGALPANISNARVYFTGTSPAFATATQFGTGAVAPAFSPTGGFSVAGSQVLSEGVNYFFLTYDVAAGSPTGDVVDGVLIGVKTGAGSVSAIAVGTGSPAGNRPILGPMSGTFTVGYELGTETYPSLTAAVADLTTRGVAPGQSVTFQLTNPGATKPYDATTAASATNRETFPIVFPAAALSAGQSISLVPATGISPLITDSNTAALLILDGSDNLVINGYDGSTSARSLTVRNAGNGPAVLLRNDATNNTLSYLTLESANTTATSGTVLFGTTTGTTGNDDNTITNCDVRAANNADTGATIPANAIYSLGTGTAAAGIPAATANSGNTVQGSSIYNFTAAGVYLNATGSGDSWTVGGATAADGNAFYQTAGRSTQLINVRLGIGNNHVVSRNQIYQTTGTVTNTYYGVSVVGAGNGTVISNNYVGGSAANAGGSPLNVNGTFYGIFLSVGNSTSTPTSVQGNVVRNVSNTTATAETHGIRVDAGLANVGTTTGNTIGDASPTAPAVGLVSTRNIFGISLYSALASTVSNNTIGGLSYLGTTAGSVVYGVYSLVDNSAHTISSNTLTSIQATSTTNANLRGIYVGGNGATPIVTDNVVSSVLNASTGANISTAGIFIGPTTGVLGPVVIRGNRISNVANTAPAAPTGSNVFTTSGLLCGASSAGTVERNRVWNVYGSSAGTGANADQVRGLAVQGAYSGTFANNQVSLAAGTTTQLSYGIQDLSSGGSTNFYYNSVYLAPASGAAASSYGFWRSATTTPPAGSLRNNIFYNERTAAAGATAYATGTATTTGWSAATSNYNLFVSTDAATVGNWGGTSLSFLDWKAAQPAGSGSDASSLSETSTVVAATSLFTDVATGNLDLNAANPEAWYANGNGVQLASQTADFGSAGTGRPTTVAAGGTDIGSDEFTPTSTPPALTASAAPALGGSQTFSLGGRTLATLSYGNAGTVPGAVVARYYSGTNPTVATATTRYTNSYLDLTATGGSSYSYDLVLHYDDALLGTVQDETNQHLLRRNGDGTYTFFPLSVTDAAGNSITATGLNSIGQFFGTDQTSPLPVTLTSFLAFRRGTDAQLDWNTATEHNNSGYEIQVATNGISYRKLGFIRSEAVNSSVLQHYQFVDTENGKQGLRYYRLKQVDLDGKETYSPVQIVSFGEATSPLYLTAAPNPFDATLTLTMDAPKPGGTVPLTVTDATGRQVYSQLVTLPAGTSRLELTQLAKLPAGMYLLHVVLAGHTQNLKVVKQ